LLVLRQIAKYREPSTTSSSSSAAALSLALVHSSASSPSPSSSYPPHHPALLRAKVHHWVSLVALMQRKMGSPGRFSWYTTGTPVGAARWKQAHRICTQEHCENGLVL
jgi:hypothetical protein